MGRRNSGLEGAGENMEEKEVLGWAKQAAQQFERVGAIREIRPYGSGHINDTFLVKGEKITFCSG